MAPAQPEPTTTTTEAPTTTTSETTTTLPTTTTTEEPTTESTEAPSTTTATTVAPASSDDDDDSFISSGAGIALIVAAIVAVVIALIALAVGASRRSRKRKLADEIEDVVADGDRVVAAFAVPAGTATDAAVRDSALRTQASALLPRIDAVRQRAGSVDPRAAAMLGDLQGQTRQVAIEAERSEQAHAGSTGAQVEYAEATLRQAVQSLETALAHARSWLRSIAR
jgi:biopolymer transport protein ExbB/TolQ